MKLKHLQSDVLSSVKEEPKQQLKAIFVQNELEPQHSTLLSFISLNVSSILLESSRTVQDQDLWAQNIYTCY